MVVPNLIRPVYATIQPASRTTTHYDSDAREPVRSVARSTAVLLPVQVHYDKIPEPEWGGPGATETVEGYLLARRVDLVAAGYTPKRGDRVTQLGHRATELYLSGTEDMGHYPDQSGASLLRLHFTDRRPSAATPAM